MENSSDRLVDSLTAAYDLVPLVTAFTLEHAGLNNVNTGIQTGAGSFVVREYDSLSYADPASIQYEHRLLDWLVRQDLSFAVPVPVPTRAGTLAYQGPRGWAALTPRLSGMPLARQPFDGERFGAAVGELQATLRPYPSAARPGRPLFGELFRFSNPKLDPLTLRPADLGLPPTPADDESFGWWREEAARLQRFVDGTYRHLPWQTCHNDLTPNNVLAQDGVVTAVVDFEFATPTAVALDFVTGLREVLRYWEQPEPWDAVRRFSEGYARWMTLSEAEIAAIPDLLRLRWAITILWWIGRSAATGTPGPIPSRLERAREHARWLDRAEEHLVDVIRRVFRGSR